MLRDLPEIGKVFLLIRRNRSNSAVRRFEKVMEDSPLFDPLFEQHGEGLTDFISQRGRPFSATLVLREETGRHGFEFPPRGKKGEGEEGSAAEGSEKKPKPEKKGKKAAAEPKAAKASKKAPAKKGKKSIPAEASDKPEKAAKASKAPKASKATPAKKAAPAKAKKKAAKKTSVRPSPP